MVRSFVCLSLSLLLIAGARASGPPAAVFGFFSPEVLLTGQELQRLDRGEVAVKILPAHGGQLAVFTATEIAAEPERVVAWLRAVSDLKRSRVVRASGRFSDPPVLADLQGLSLDPRDLSAVRACRPGDCALKLSGQEIESLRRVADTGSANEVQQAFRRVVLARVLAYRTSGLAGLELSAGGGGAHQASAVFSALLESSTFLVNHAPLMAGWLQDRARADGREIESFMYWAKEDYSPGKPVIGVTDVGIARATDGATPEVLVAGKQIFATRYMNGALNLTALVREQDGGRRYLVHMHRSQLDLLTGFFGGLGRAVAQSRLRERTPSLLRDLRSRMEGGPPPGTAKNSAARPENPRFQPLPSPDDAIPPAGDRSRARRLLRTQAVLDGTQTSALPF